LALYLKLAVCVEEGLVKVRFKIETMSSHKRFLEIIWTLEIMQTLEIVRALEMVLALEMARAPAMLRALKMVWTRAMKLVLERVWTPEIVCTRQWYGYWKWYWHLQ
jgi:hypothetical protein